MRLCSRGKSRPVSKPEGCAVVAGSFNLSAMVEMQVQALGESTRFAEIVGLMEQASTQKPRLAQLADKVAGPFLLGILLLAAATAAYWWPHDPGKGLLYAAVVLIVYLPLRPVLGDPGGHFDGGRLLGAARGVGAQSARIGSLGQGAHDCF